MISSSHPQAALTPAQAQAQHAAAIQELEQAKRRSRRPIDKDMPEGMEEVTIGNGVQRYKDLRNLERRLDAATMRKKLDIQDAVNRNLKVRTVISQTLRSPYSTDLTSSRTVTETQDSPNLDLEHRRKPAMARRRSR